MILAGGEGTRLRPLTSTRPKPMINVVGKPVMEHVVGLLKAQGLMSLEVTLHYMAQSVQEYFEDGSRFGVEISYSREETPLGTAGSVKNIEDRLDDTFLVISGDLLTDLDLSKIIHFHKERGALVTIGLTRVPNPLQYGIITTDAEGRVERFFEKPGWGEVFTDTINAGVYLIEPEALRPVEKGKVFDFSKNLFPMLLERKEPLFGCLLEGYWCDIGTIQQYVQSNYDALQGVVKLEIPGSQVEKGLWVGEGTDIRKGTVIEKPAYIGSDCVIKRSFIGALSVVADGVTIDEKASIKRSIILDRSLIGSGAELLGCIIGERCNIGSYASVYDFATIGDECSIGTRAVVKPEIRIWPRKTIDDGAVMSEDMRWGERWVRDLFGPWGLSGQTNIDYTPEFIAKFGAAVGTFFGRKRQVAVVRDTSKSSRMIKRALTAGLCSAGLVVYNLRITPAPVVRLYVRKHNLAGGIFIKIPQFDPRSVNIQIFDSSGINLDKTCEKKIQDILSRGDIRRASYDEVGVLIYPAGFEEDYIQSLNSFTDPHIIAEFRPSVVVDCSNGAGSTLIPRLLSNLGCEVIPLNTRLDEFAEPKTLDDLASSFAEITQTIKEKGADIGLMFDTDAERVTLFDEGGRAVAGDTALALMAKVTLKGYEGGKVVVPVTASQTVEIVCKRYGCSVISSKLGTYQLINTICEEKALFGGDERGGFVLPNFQKNYDAIAATVKLLEALSRERQLPSDMIRDMPLFVKAEGVINCPWRYKGMIMRALIDAAGSNRIDTTVGLKVFHKDGWVAIIPSSEEPVMSLYAEAGSKESAEALISSYMAKIRALIPAPRG